MERKKKRREGGREARTEEEIKPTLVSMLGRNDEHTGYFRKKGWNQS